MPDPIAELLRCARQIIDHQDPATADPPQWIRKLESLEAVVLFTPATENVAPLLEKRVKDLHKKCLGIAMHYAIWRKRRTGAFRFPEELAGKDKVPATLCELGDESEQAAQLRTQAQEAYDELLKLGK